MNIISENRYWEEFIAGGHEAFRGLYDRYADMLFGYGCLYVRDRELVKDCLHDLFVDLDRYRAGLNPNVNVKAYLLASLRRKLLAAQQKQPAYTAIESLEEYAVCSDVPNAESRMISTEQEITVMKRLHSELNKLPTRQREVLHLKFNMELSYTEIAGLMEISEATSRTLAYRAIRRLRESMENQPFITFFIFFLKNSL